MKYGCCTGFGKIEALLLKHPKDAFIDQENILDQWQDLHFSDCPDYNLVVEEYEYFISLLKETIPGIHFLPHHKNTGLDSIYVHDPVVITPRGAVLCSMGKEQRQGEPAAIREYLEESKIPILGSISGTGRLEAGDVVLFDEKSLAVGQGYRTNSEGIRQLQELTGDFVKEIVVVQLPHWNGPQNILHLMSLISPIDQNLAAVYSRLMPVPFRQWLIGRGIKLIEVPDSEYETMGCNILAVEARKCIMIAGNPRAKKMLEDEGVEVREFQGEEVCKKGSGGPTCLTRPLLRL